MERLDQHDQDHDIWVKTDKKDPVKIEKMVYQIEIEQNCYNKIELPKEGINVFSNKE